MARKKILEEMLKTLPEIIPPEKLKKRTVSRLWFFKWRFLIYGTFFLLIINFGLLYNHIYRQLRADQALIVIGSKLKNFQMSLDYVSSSILTLHQTLPHLDSAALFVNLILVIYWLTIFRHYRHELL
jgi:hypothetical protein